MTELLVCIAVAGLLLSLVASAIQHTRHTARRIRCASRLRQVALAFGYYHDAHGVLPVRLRPFVRILPFIEQEKLYRAMENPQLSVNPDVEAFVCPSDPLASPALGHTSFLINEGSRFGIPVPDGIPVSHLADRFTKFSDITDGLSNTSLLSERLLPVADGTDAIRSFYYTGNAHIGAGLEDAFRIECLRNRTVPTPVSFPTYYEYLNTNHGYNHVLPPNQVACHNGPPPASDATFAAIPATSLHGGGVNLAFADSHVRFVGDSISMEIWLAIGSRSAGDSVSGF